MLARLYCLTPYLGVIYLAACSGFQPQSSPTIIQQSATAAAHGKDESWMLPGATGEDLLYVSLVTLNKNDVTVYSWPEGKVVGALSVSVYADGECVDKAGDVYISAEDDIVEYAHGGTKPIATLSGGLDSTCSVDPTTGNLAVVASNGVFIYRNARGKPARYQAHDLFNSWGCAYDNQGDLFVDGVNSKGESGLGELSKGARTFKDIEIDRPPAGAFGGPMQWDEKYLAVGAGDDEIYEFKISGSKGVEVRSTILKRSNTVIFWIQGSKIAATYNYGSAVGIWNYPAGGSPIKAIHHREFIAGVTVSLAVK